MPRLFLPRLQYSINFYATSCSVFQILSLHSIVRFQTIKSDSENKLFFNSFWLAEYLLFLVELDNLSPFLPRYYGSKLLSPYAQGFPFFLVVTVPIINGSHTRFNMVQGFRDGEPLDAGCGHHTGGGSPEIVWGEMINLEMMGIDSHCMVNWGLGDMLPVSGRGE